MKNGYQISKKELIEYTKLKLLSEITLTKEKLNLSENKDNCTLEEFGTRIIKSKEKFEEWDDYIEWKAYSEWLQHLKKKLNELYNAKDIKIVWIKIMKSKLKIYLDTSVISALFDKRNPERMALTESFFEEIDLFRIFISNITIAEIIKTPDDNLKKKMNDIIVDFSILESSNEAETLAEKIVKEGAINKAYLEDAYHIAIAIINEMDFLLSWNFRHIVRKKTRDIVRMICTIKNLKYIEILTPAELL